MQITRQRRERSWREKRERRNREREKERNGAACIMPMHAQGSVLLKPPCNATLLKTHAMFASM